MEIFGLTFGIGNKLGLYSLISLLFLLMLYLMRPKPFKKIIPSVIFLETEKRRLKMTTFLKRFVKDWLFLVHLLILLMLCLAALGLTTEVLFKKLSKEVTFVIDASASSQAVEDKMMFDKYKEFALKHLGVRNSIILVKNSPVVVVKQTNPVNAYRTIASLKPSESLSNIWDSIMIASDVSNPGATIIVLSDLIDTNDRDIKIARRILEAMGFKVQFVNLRTKGISNIGIIKYVISGNKAILDIKNFDDSERQVKLGDDTIKINPYAVEQAAVELKEGLNEIKIITDDNFKVDDTIRVLLPKKSETKALYISNNKDSYALAVFQSLKSISVELAEPPIVNVDDQDLFILDHVDYKKLLPGTIDEIIEEVERGSSVIIIVQDDLNKVENLLPVNLIKTKEENVEIYNTKTIEKLEDYDFELSTKYYETEIKDNSSVIIAEATDKINSPIIVLDKYGVGNIFYYGIYDFYNPFKLSSRYPLFWIHVLEMLQSSNPGLNYKIGNVVYSDEIRDPDNVKIQDYAVLDKTGIYKLKDKEISVNLLNVRESDLNKIIEISDIDTEDLEKVKQDINLLPILVIIIILVSFLELYILKKRGDI